MADGLLEHETSELSIEDLLEIERTQERTSDRPSALPLMAVRVAPEVFQWRHFEAEFAAEEAHVNELVRVLEATKAPLDPIRVTPVGASFFVVDGHHRVLAYRNADWSELVPVDYFEGSVEDARLEALRLNIKNKLPMTSQDKLEAAWTLTQQGEKFSKREIRELTSASDGTVANMRRVLKQYPQAKDLTWRQAKALEIKGDYDFDDQLEKKADQLAKALMKSLGTNPTRRSEIIALALTKVDKALPAALIQHWREEVATFAEELAGMEELDI